MLAAPEHVLAGEPAHQPVVEQVQAGEQGPAGHDPQGQSQRTGQPLSPAARLLLIGPQVSPLRLERRVVIEVADRAIADGLLQWPETRWLIEARLGPSVLAVSEENLPRMEAKLRELGVSLQAPGEPGA